MQQRIFFIFRYLGVMLLFASLIFFLTLGTFLFYPEEIRFIPMYLFPGLGLLLLGGGLYLLFKHHQPHTISSMEGTLIVVLAWIVSCITAALPFTQILDLSFPQALFESVSGWTTTGLSMVDVEVAPRTLLLYRSITQLAGGAGLAIIMLAAVQLPVGAGLYRAEGRNDQLLPNVARSTKLVLSLYISYVSAGTVAYQLAGMSWFDAVNHSFAAVSTGGFSTKAASIGYWDSAMVEGVSIVLMILGNLNFLTAWLLLQGKVRAFLKNGEVKTFLILFVLSSICFYVTVGRALYEQSKAVRVSLFEMATALTTTGFSTVSYTQWYAPGFLLLFILMIVGGGSCSTAGGVKQFRIYVLFKTIFWEVHSIALPRRAVRQKVVFHGESPLYLEDKDIVSIGSFFFTYLLILLSGSTIISLAGYSVKESLFEMASALGTVGLTLGVTSTNTPNMVLGTLTAGMFLGRLEIFVILSALRKVFRP